ncbi:MAG: asparagine synthase (glutamine-hydrolyzing), partial [Bacteroidota bacterium]
VILKSYQQWGIACVDRFRGMFAIVLLDPTNDAMYLVRDRAGVKPLYYYKKGSYLLFGSELKSFHQHPGFKKELDPDATSLYFRFGYVPAPHCIFKDAFKVKPGHFLKVDLKDGTIDEKSYWNAFDAYNHPRTTVSYEDALEKTEAVLSDAFRLRMVSDVPVGLFLSGGYDSTCVAALLQKEAMRPLNTYTIGFEEKSFNEADHARQVASHLGTNHHEHICTHKEALDIVPALAEIYDEPFGDSSAVPTILVSRFARHHVKVALSADAGDELFAGYPRHAKNIRQLTRLSFVPGFVSKSIGGLLPRSIPSMVKADRYGKLIGILSTDDTIKRFMITNEVFTLRESCRLMRLPVKLLSSPFDENHLLDENNDELSRILAVEYRTYLVEDILRKVDMATMSAGLEGREPFLDHKILEWVATLPSEYKFSKNKQKRILKDIVHKYVPAHLMERPKMGFGIPLVKWMRSELRDLFNEVMDDRNVAATGILDVETVRNMKTAYLEGRLENFERLWFIFSFLAWHKRWMSPSYNIA